jgi:hypothetical protein
LTVSFFSFVIEVGPSQTDVTIEKIIIFLFF